MTQQYVAGELSMLLGRLQQAATLPVGDGVAKLRQEAENRPLAELPSVAARALNLTDAMCWHCLARGDVAAFADQVVIAAELHEFGVCAGLLADR